MGGIIGKLTFERSVAISDATVQRMLEALAHRGGGAAGGRHATYIGHGIALGSCGASYGEMRASRQHVAHNETGTVRTVADSDLSNAASLRCLLEDRGHLLRDATNAELIAHAYEEWGDACVERFAGSFACAIWDETRRRLVLARDPFGVRPLCFAFGSRGIVFASGTTPLLQDPWVAREWQPEAIDAYLALGYVPSPFTIYRQVSKLEPGHLLVVEGRRLTTRCYWDARDSASRQGTGGEAVDLLERLLFRSVSSVGRESQAVLMSGGLGSTAVAAMLPHGSMTVTVGLDQDPADLDRVFHTATHLGLRSEIDIAVPDPAAIVRRIVSHFDEPAADPAAISQYAVFVAARQYTDVALTGHGAAAFHDWEAQTVFDEALRQRLYTRRFAWQVAEGEALARCGADARMSLADNHLAVAVRTAAAAGLRLRHPFMERDLAATRMDDVRQVAARYLPAWLMPPARRNRPVPMWLADAVQCLVPPVLLGERFDTRGIFNRPALQALWAEHQRDRAHTHRLWSLLMLEFWVREFIDGDVAARPAEHAVLVRAA